MTEDKDVNDTADSSSAEDVNTPATSAEQTSQTAEQPDSQATETTAEPKQSKREALIAKLTAQEEKTDEETVDEDSGEQTPEVASETAEDGTPTKADETTETPAQPVDDGLLTERDKTFGEGAQARIRQLVREKKESDNLAAFGADILDRAQKAGIEPKAFVNWVDLGAVIQKDPAAGVKRLLGMAQQMGWKPEPQTVAPELATLVEKLEKDLEISDAAAAQIKKYLAPKPAAPAQQAPPVQEQNDEVIVKAREDRAVGEMNKIVGTYQKTIQPADWKVIDEEAAKELLKFKGAPPEMWPTLFQNAVELVIARRKAARPVTKTVTPTLRPTTSTSTTGATTYKNNRERVLDKYAK